MASLHSYGRSALGVLCICILTSCGGSVAQSGSSAGAPATSIGGDAAVLIAGSGGSIEVGGSGPLAFGGSAGSGGNQCLTVGTDYSAALERLKACDPKAPNQCTSRISYGLSCGCETFVNPSDEAALLSLSSAQQRYGELNCAVGVTCGACAPPSSSFCSPDGRCEDASSQTGTAACKVGDQVYPSGAAGIPDPTSCNTCSCNHGDLSCTEINCPTPCAPGTVSGSRCAACGPTDGCDVVEYGCLPVCTSQCELGSACLNGVCRAFCG